jgi:ribonuclease BN (tRNA processing enzyme)
VRLTIVGASGTFPGPHSGCSSYLLEQDGFRLLIDVGNGSTGALQEVCGLLGPDAVAVSHLHGDHYLDLITYTYARRYHPSGAPKRLPVYGPRDIREHVAATFARNVDELLDAVYEFRPLEQDGVLDIGPFRIDLRRVNHPVETYGMRITAGDKTVAYSADTGASDALVDLARGVDLFLCEASYLEGEDNPPNIHLTGTQAGEHASRADVGRLLLTHLVPWGDEARTLTEATGAFSGTIDVARPLAYYDL